MYPWLLIPFFYLLALKGSSSFIGTLWSWDTTCWGGGLAGVQVLLRPYLLLELAHHVPHQPLFLAQTVSLPKLKPTVEVFRPSTPKLLLPVQYDRLILTNNKKNTIYPQNIFLITITFNNSEVEFIWHIYKGRCEKDTNVTIEHWVTRYYGVMLLGNNHHRCFMYLFISL